MDSARYCARPACGGPASASMTYDYARRLVRLTNLVVDPDPAWCDLCDRHAARMSVPVGWVLEDGRTPIIPLRPPIAV